MALSVSGGHDHGPALFVPRTGEKEKKCGQRPRLMWNSMRKMSQGFCFLEDNTTVQTKSVA